jgi:hypothetical protein
MTRAHLDTCTERAVRPLIAAAAGRMPGRFAVPSSPLAS